MRGSSRSFEESVVQADLNYWGFWKGLQHAAEGYSPMNTLSQLLSGRSDNPGHRVLCLDMKPRAWQINARVYRLDREHIAALTARYCLPVKNEGPERGSPYRATELAVFLGVTPETYLERLRRARAAYKAIIFPDLVLRRATC